MIKSKRCVLSFAFCRPISLARSVLSIKMNYSTHKDYTHVLVVDRAKKNGHRYQENQETIEFAYKLMERGFVDELRVRDEPYGTQQNIIQGVSEMAHEFEHLFVVEDDLELIHYHKDLTDIFFKHQLRESVVAFSTYSHLMKKKRFSTFLSHRFSSQAWGTTSRAWSGFDVEYIKKQAISDVMMREIVMHLGSDMPSAIAGFKSGAVDSWAIPWNVYNFLNGSLMAYPSISYVLETGHQAGATRTGGIRFKSELATGFINTSNMQPAGDLQVASEYTNHFNIFNRGARKLQAKLRDVLT